MFRFSLSGSERAAMMLALAVLPLDYPVEDEAELASLKFFLDVLAGKLDSGTQLFSADELELLCVAATSALAFLSHTAEIPLPDDLSGKLRPNFFVYNGIASRLQTLLADPED